MSRKSEPDTQRSLIVNASLLKFSAPFWPGLITL
jgi:hypothetical protein